MLNIKTWTVLMALMCAEMLCAQANGATPSTAELFNYNAVGDFLRNWGENDHWWQRSKNVNRASSSNSNASGPMTSNNGDSNWMPNSNKIGLSYNPLAGNPVCFTGDCQMSGFGLPLFQMEFTEQAEGTCVTQLVPKNVLVDCLPSTEHVSTTETISDLKGLKNSESNGVSWGVGFDLNLGGSGGPLSSLTSLSFNYNQAKQTRFIIDNIYVQDSTTFYTYVKVSHFRLSLYHPLLNLSVAFRHVIENMPSENSTLTEKYINDYILNYFGTTFVSDLLLGGIAQMTSVVSNSKLQPTEQKTQSAAVSAGLTFGKIFNFNYKTDDNASNEQIKNFTQDATKIYSTTMGGSAFAVDTQKLSDWFLSVPSNPVITRFTIGSIFDLLTNDPNRFPNDPFLSKKVDLIMQTLAKQLNSSKVYCENDCTSPAHGTCTPTNYFQFGRCVCLPPFTGEDCSSVITPTSTTLPPAPAPAPGVGR